MDAFLDEHGGPGLQHIGLYSDDIVHTVDEMIKRDVGFRKPPPTYYSSVSLAEKICQNYSPANILNYQEHQIDITLRLVEYF